MDLKFSAKSRTDIKTQLRSEKLDLLVIGGGITGAGILLDAHTRGLSAALIEMQDFASGTSNRSTKLVHGGLRYLKQFEIGLVAEVGKERAIVYENGPHITTPVWMLLPIIKGGTYGKFASSIGIYVYDKLAGVKHSERRRMLNYEQTLRKEPLLRREGLKGSGYYVEYRTDDARLTLEILKEAAYRGATALNYTKAENLLYQDGRVVGVAAKDMFTTETYDIFAKKVVNATGPWVDELRDLDRSKSNKTLHLTKGVHIVVDGERFPLQNAVYFDVPDGRMVFAIPRDHKTYIGTTDTDYHGDPAAPRMTRADEEYLIRCVNYMFPSVKLTPQDVESSWAGVRPLIHEEGKGPSEISRKDEVFHSPTGLITIAGGKLTGYRKMADKVVSLVTGELSHEERRQFGPCVTAKLPYSGGRFNGSENFKLYTEEKVREGVELGLAKEEAAKLSRRYGTNVDVLYELIRARAEEAATSGLAKGIFGALAYGIDFEMVATPADFFIRRTGSLYFDIQWLQRWKEPVTAYMAKEFGWDPELVQKYRIDLDERIVEATTPQKE